MTSSRPLLAVLLVGLFPLVCSHAAGQASSPSLNDESGRSFVVVQRSSMRIAQGEWSPSAPLFRYVHDHPAGSYVVFEQSGGVYRLDDPGQMKTVEGLYAPMHALSAQAGRARARAETS